MNRTALAALVAPLLPALIAMQDTGLAFALAYSYVLSYALGLPVVWTLKKLKCERLWIYAVAGFSAGALFILIINSFHPEALIAAGIFGFLGLLTAVCFSLIQRGLSKSSNTRMQEIH